jgi:hypothetical protein
MISSLFPLFQGPLFRSFVLDVTFCSIFQLILLHHRPNPVVPTIRSSHPVISTTLFPCPSFYSARFNHLVISTSANRFFVRRLHWIVPPLDGFLPTALSFHPALPNHLVISTSANRLHVVDVRAKSTVDWNRLVGEPLPQQLLEFPGGITGLSVDPLGESLGLVAYGPK